VCAGGCGTAAAAVGMGVDGATRTALPPAYAIRCNSMYVVLEHSEALQVFLFFLRRALYLFM